MASAGVILGGAAIGAAGKILGTTTSGIFGTKQTKIKADAAKEINASNNKTKESINASNNTARAERQSSGQNFADQQAKQSQSFWNSQFEQKTAYADAKIEQRNNAYESAGLPSYLGYGSGSTRGLSGPPVAQQKSGASTYQSRIAGNPTTGAYTGSSVQTGAGWGNIL